MEADGAVRDAALPSLRDAPVDVLFVVDNSISMLEEHEALARQLPRFVRSLAAGELRSDDDASVLLRFDPVDDLHLGVVSTDMGTGGVEVFTCEDAADGDDGVLSPGVAPDCSGSMPPFLSFGAGDAPDAFAADAACRLRLGTDGCGFEQPLEAAIKALLPAGANDEVGIDPFLTGEGHGSGANAGFLREDSILLVLVLTDEDDCSAREQGFFEPSRFGGPSTLNVRCQQNPEALFSVERYARALRWLRRGDPRRLLFAAIVGIPPGTGSTASGPTDWARIACTSDRAEAGTCHPDLVPTVVDDGRGVQQLRPSCDTSTGRAFPPNRIVQVAERIDSEGSQAVVGSICQEEFSVPMEIVVRRLAALRR